jgi:PhnB protein
MRFEKTNAVKGETTMAAINPYLTFNGNCDQAFEFYKSVFGGEFLSKMRFTDMDTGHPVPEAEKNRIMHVTLPIGPTVLMGSDSISSVGPVTAGDNFSIAIKVESEAEADKLFAGLSAGGKVTMPMGKVFWGAYFGMFTDKFGIQWMISYDYAQHK